jgi:hypothetical protein
MLAANGRHRRLVRAIAIALKSPNRTGRPDAHILNGSQTAETTADIAQVRLFHPPTPRLDLDFWNFRKTETDPRLVFENFQKQKRAYPTSRRE